jgi:hypothetical protein
MLRLSTQSLRPSGEPADLSALPPQKALCVVDKSDEYRRKAEYCERMALAELNEFARAEWLQLATLWRQMIQPKGAVKDDQQ